MKMTPSSSKQERKALTSFLITLVGIPSIFARQTYKMKLHEVCRWSVQIRNWINKIHWVSPLAKEKYSSMTRKYQLVLEIVVEQSRFPRFFCNAEKVSDRCSRAPRLLRHELLKSGILKPVIFATNLGEWLWGAKTISQSAVGKPRKLRAITISESVGFNLKDGQVGNVEVKRSPVSHLQAVGYITFS